MNILGCEKMTVYKIFTEDQYTSLKQVSTFSGNPTDITSGFIHLSFEAQIDGILKKFFAGHAKVVIAEIDPRQIDSSKLRVESNPGGKTKYPHYYGAIPYHAFVNFVEKTVLE